MPHEAIDPRGDLMVDCAEVRLLVSSRVLALASPVFNAMFQPYFKEGIALMSSTQPSNISLPDDDPESFRLFCYAAHHQSSAAPSQVKPETLHNLAIFLDKYQCGHVMRHQGEMWLKQSGKPSREQIWSLILFAYSINSATLFMAWSSRLIIWSSESIGNWDFAKDNLAFMPVKVLDTLEKRRKRLYIDVQAAIASPGLKLQSEVDKKCTVKDRLLGAYFHGLYSADILLLSGFTPSVFKGFFDIYQCAAQFPAYSYNCEIGRAGCECSKFGGADQKHRLQTLLYECLDANGCGLCLPCLKDDQCKEHPDAV